MELFPLIDSRLEFGTAQGQLVFWDSTLSQWVHTETSELFWNDTSKGLSLITGELTYGSINRASGTLTIEIGATAAISISSSATTLGGNLIIPDDGLIG